MVKELRAVIVQGSLERQMLLVIKTYNMFGDLPGEPGKWVGLKGALTENRENVRRLNRVIALWLLVQQHREMCLALQWLANMVGVSMKRRGISSFKLLF